MKKCKMLSIPSPFMFMIEPCTFIYIGLQDFAFFCVSITYCFNFLLDGEILFTPCSMIISLFFFKFNPFTREVKYNV